ncbi:map kinase [Moniliophthora roreri]|nr:map kinase [Moniliophthora roreri]KAI3599060.1 map kinase [Moniliophthora roreri]
MIQSLLEPEKPTFHNLKHYIEIHCHAPPVNIERDVSMMI